MDWCWSWNSSTLATWLEDWVIRKDPHAGKDWRQEENGMTEDEMVGWQHWLDGHEFEQALGVGDGQGSLACCHPWGSKESDMTEWLNWTEYFWEIVERGWHSSRRQQRENGEPMFKNYFKTLILNDVVSTPESYSKNISNNKEAIIYRDIDDWELKKHKFVINKYFQGYLCST